MEKFGTAAKSERGFSTVFFSDGYKKECSLQCSSAIGSYEDSFDRPGTSYLWVGLIDAEPMVLAREAKSVGVETSEDTGWVEYPIPDNVLISTQMHLNREQVEGLVYRLKEWLENGKFE